MVAGSTGGGLARRAAVVAWLIASAFYFYQYVLRSAPSVMLPELAHGFGIPAVALTSLLGVFYIGYSLFSLVAGIAMDQLGPRKLLAAAAAVVGVGSLAFAAGDPALATLGRFLQGAAGVFALIGAAYIASTHLPASQAATLIGATQMIGMAGGSAGQFLVGPAVAAGMPWAGFWAGGGLAGLALAGAILVLTPDSKPAPATATPTKSSGWARNAARALVAVARNPQSILCGLIAGLLFAPTTIFDMVWGVRFLQDAHDMPYSMAVMRSASVPFGWIIGCPLFGTLSDRLGRRKPLIAAGAAGLLACLVLILFAPRGIVPPFTFGLLMGIASGAAMLPYTVIKEANRPEHGGTATGVVNFLAFSMTALLGPVFGRLLTRASGGGGFELAHYREAFAPMIVGVGLALVLVLFLRETGRAAASRSGRSAGQEERLDARVKAS
jgi:MFS family permease